MVKYVRRHKTIALYVVAILVTAGVASLLGRWGSEYWLEVTMAEPPVGRDFLSAKAIEKMKNLAIGDTLVNHVFEDMDRNPVSLDSLITGKSVITYVSTMCGACSLQIDQIIKLAEDSSDLKSFIFVSYENPRLLEEDIASLATGIEILYDHRRVYAKRYGVFTFPFNIIVDRDRRITNLISGRLLSEEILDIMKSNRMQRQEQSG